jgi:uncharacterized protein YdeI (YjbR/CyaY-like superfamily)
MNLIVLSDRLAFREWLAEHALSDEGVWVQFEKQAKAGMLKAGEALEEALCFGWIDGQMQRIDELKYRKYFKQRGNTSHWSDKNKRLVEKLESEGRMTDFGRAKVNQAKHNGSWAAPKAEPLTEEQLQQFADRVKPHEDAYSHYITMTPSARKAYAASYWIGAKTEAGKEKRFAAIVERLKLNLNPMESMKKKDVD